MKFNLLTATGHKFTESDYDQSLLELRLVPASVLTFVLISDTGVKVQHDVHVLKPEIILLLQQL